MKLKMILTGGLLLSGVLFSTVQVNAQDVSKLSPKEYKAELARWQSRETSAGSESSRLGRDIESLIKQIADIDKTIALERQAIFGLRASSDEEIREYMDMLKELELDVANLNNLSEEELMGDAELLEDMELRLEKLSENDLAALEQNRNLLSDIDKMLSNYRTVIPEPTQDDESLAEVKTDGEVPKVVQFDRKADSYRVIRGDSLWKISGKEIIYNDPFQWLKIYSANRDQISNPDLIEIDQVFVIPRTPASNEHWVSRGESLSKIAAMRYSNPFEWTKIYQANKTILESPDLIHPHTILIIPKKN